MRKDIEKINKFSLAETAKWSDNKVAEYYAFSMQHSLFLDGVGKDAKPAFPKHFKPEGQRQSELMAQVLKQAGLSVA